MLVKSLEVSPFHLNRKAAMKCQRGAASIEYALIASLIALAIIVGVGATGEANAQSWSVWTGKVIAVVNEALGH